MPECLRCGYVAPIFGLADEFRSGLRMFYFFETSEKAAGIHTGHRHMMGQLSLLQSQWSADGSLSRLAGIYLGRFEGFMNCRAIVGPDNRASS